MKKILFNKRLMVWLLVGVTALLLLDLAGHLLIFRNIQATTLQQIEAEQEQHLLYKTSEIEFYLQEIFSDLQDMLPPDRSLPGWESALNDNVAKWSDSHISRYLISVFLIDTDGNIMASHPAGSAIDPSLAIAPLQNAGDSHDGRLDTRLLQAGEKTLLHMLLRLWAEDRTSHTLNLIIDLNALLETYGTPSPRGGKFLAMLDQKGRVIISPDPALQGRTLTSLLPQESLHNTRLHQAVTRGLTRSFMLEKFEQATAEGQAVIAPSLLSLSPIRLPGKLWSLAYNLPNPQQVISPIAERGIVVILLLTAGGMFFILWLALRNYRQQSSLSQLVDTHEQQQEEFKKELNLQQNRYEQLLYSANEGLFFIDLETGKLLDINRRAEELLGYSRSEVEHLSLKSLFPRPSRYRFWRMVATVRRKGFALQEELQFRRKDGSLFVGAVQARAGWLGEQRVAHGSFRDVTPTVNLAMELRRHNRRLSLLNEISQRVAEGHDLPETLEIVLDQVVDSLAVSGGGIFLLHQQGMEMQLAIHRNIPAEVLDDLKKIEPGKGLVGKVATSGQPRLSTNLQNDHRRLSQLVANDNWHAFLAVPMIAGEKTLGVLFIFDRGQKVLNREDVRLMQAIGRQVGPLVKNAELIDELQWQQRLNEASMREIERSRLALRDNLEELEKTHRMLESLDKMKSTFLGLASHELRTPLTTILCGAELLETLAGETLSSDSSKALEAIQNGSQRLNQIVNELLEAARLEARALYLASEAFAPRAVIEQLIAEYQTVCNERQLVCRLKAFPNNIVIRGDAYHLSRALDRILENAVKFTPSGGEIRVEGHILSQDDVKQQEQLLRLFSETFFHRPRAESYLAINVLDNGIGLAPSEHKKIFDKFYEVGDITAHSSSKVDFGGKGVGLGLTLVKGIVEAHDGLVWVESNGEQQGCCFSVLLPINAAEDNGHG